MDITTKIIKYLIKNPPNSEVDLSNTKRNFCKQLKIHAAPTNAELLTAYRKLKLNLPQLKNLLTKRQVRTISGIAPIAVLTKPYTCPGNCAYCPKEEGMPTSYLSNEPAVMRAILCKFDPYTQVNMRLQALQNNGHSTNKLELIVMGGTWSYLPKNYQTWYIKECFRAANDFPKKIKIPKQQNITKLTTELNIEQKKNEQAKNKIIGLTLETRPDYINEQELISMRNFGCTRIEIGIQHTDNKILKLNQRGHTVEQTIQATQLMRSFGFKITYHIMLNLPGSTPARDLKMMQTIYNNPNFQPDQIKLYPTVVAKGALIYKWHQQGKWQAYTTQQLINLIVKIKSITPPWVRIIRVIRDIPAESIIAGNNITNLRQNIQQEMNQQKLTCNCIRCREAGRAHINIKTSKHLNKLDNTVKLITRKYKVQNGTEYFLSFESKDKKILYAFCRLFLPTISPPFQEGVVPLNGNGVVNIAIIRELHTYGQLTPVGQTGSVQHHGLGKQLLAQAETITKQKKYAKLSVISGIGVRAYYRKLGYKLKNTYMIKNI